MDINPKDIVIQEDELTKVKWFSMKELEDMVSSGKLNQF
jgi:NADH pyrophosphatase NudC (nudix superfamily)